MYFGIFLAALVVAAGLRFGVRRRETRSSYGASLSDDMLRQIEEQGRLELDEPLDLAQISEEEDRFWESEPWDEAEET